MTKIGEVLLDYRFRGTGNPAEAIAIDDAAATDRHCRAYSIEFFERVDRETKLAFTEEPSTWGRRPGATEEIEIRDGRDRRHLSFRCIQDGEVTYWEHSNDDRTIRVAPDIDVDDIRKWVATYEEFSRKHEHPAGITHHLGGVDCQGVIASASLGAKTVRWYSVNRHGLLATRMGGRKDPQGRPISLERLIAHETFHHLESIRAFRAQLQRLTNVLRRKRGGFFASLEFEELSQINPSYFDEIRMNFGACLSEVTPQSEEDDVLLEKCAAEIFAETVAEASLGVWTPIRIQDADFDVLNETAFLAQDYAAGRPLRFPDHELATEIALRSDPRQGGDARQFIAGRMSRIGTDSRSRP